MNGDPFEWRDFAFGYVRLLFLLSKSDIAQSLVNLYLRPPKQKNCLNLFPLRFLAVFTCANPALLVRN